VDLYPKEKGEKYSYMTRKEEKVGVPNVGKSFFSGSKGSDPSHGFFA